MKKVLLWLWLLTKRLYRRPVFVALLLLIPLVVAGYALSARADSGILTVALAQEDDDPRTRAVLEQVDDSRLLRCVFCDSPEEAETLVRMGKADAAWIFREDLTEKVVRFARSPEQRNAFVTVLVRRDTVALRLSREKLSGTVFSLVARQVYLDYIRQEVPELSELSDDQLLEYYEKTSPDGELFRFSDEMEAAQTHYLTAPVRGLLAVLLLVAGLSVSLLHMEDLEKGTFGRLGSTGRSLVEWGEQLVCLSHVGAAALLSLAVCSLTGAVGRELCSLAVCCISTAGFCIFLRRLCRKKLVLAALLPLLTAAALVGCPVFLEGIPWLQWLLPPTFFVTGTAAGLVHTAVTVTGSFLLELLYKSYNK